MIARVASRRGVSSQSAGQWLSKLQQEYGSKLIPTHRISLDLLHRCVAPCVLLRMLRCFAFSHAPRTRFPLMQLRGRREGRDGGVRGDPLF